MAKRRLLPSEVQLAKKIFGQALDYDVIRVAARRIPFFQPKNGGLCTGNTINISGTAYKDDYCNTDKAHLRAFFIHEMTHIWQFQKSPSYLGKKLAKELSKHHFNYMAKAYRYDLPEGKLFDDFGLEQQACIVQDYFALKHNGGKGMSGQCYANLDSKALLPVLENLLHDHFPVRNTDPSYTRPNGPKP